MTRQFKFRIWHKKEKRWFDPWAEEDPILSLKDFGRGCEVYLYDRKTQSHSNVNCQMDDVVIQQYTGLKDKDGVEIYEGDILGFGENFEDNKELSKVVWAKAYSGEQWCEITIRNYYGSDVQSDHPDDFYGGVNTQKVVVGNIFEGVKNEEANIH